MDVDLPDPTDRDIAWWCGEPAYLPWWRALTTAGGDRPSADGFAVNDLIRLYGYAVPTAEALDHVAALGPLIELGAGAGYWARLLRDRGGDVVAYDVDAPDRNSWIADASPWTHVDLGDESMVAAHVGRAMFVSWPPRPSGFMSVVLDRYPPTDLALITDGRLPAGIPDPLYDRLEARWLRRATVHLPQWPHRFDALTLWRRRR